MTKISEALEAFMLEQRIRLNSDRTIRDYREKLALWVKFMEYDCDIESVTLNDMRRYIDTLRDRKLSRETIRSYITTLKVAWSFWADEYNITDHMQRIKKPKPSKAKPKGVNAKDFIKVMEATGDDLQGIRNRALLALLADTGARRGGMVNLTLDNLDLETRRGMVIEKGFKRRTIFWTSYTNRLLRKWLINRPTSEDDNVFVSLRDGHKPLALTGDGVYQIFTRLKKKAAVKGRVNPHAFRHNFARLYLLHKGDGITLARLLGWADLRMAERYAVFDEDELVLDQRN